MLIFTVPHRGAEPDGQLESGGRGGSGGAPEALDRVLQAVLPEVDVVQVRVKAPGRRSGPSPARPLLEWARRALGHVAALEPERRPLVLVNDRVDVARLLAGEGLDGVHLGASDLPPAAAREQLGPDVLIGLSTNGARTVLAAEDEPVDYLGLGPIFPSRTKGYERGLGPEVAWAGSAAAGRPVFPIGGVDLANAVELQPVGRAAVGSAVLDAPDPARAAAELRELLVDPLAPELG